MIHTKIATHEAGHAIVADALGFSALRCGPIEDGFAVTHEGPDDPTPLECFHLAVVACAGCCAQELAGYAVTEEDARNDMNSALPWLACFIGHDHVPHASTGLLSEPLNRAHDLAMAILTHKSNTLTQLASLFVRKAGQASTAEILAVLRK